MTFPSHISRVLDDYGVPADTKAALYDLYISMGEDVLDAFADISERVVSPAHLRPEDTGSIKARVVERYLIRNHPLWFAGTPTASLWYPRPLEGRASGLATPLGDLPDAAREAIGTAQPVPEGILMLGKNAHYGGRLETISFDIVAGELADAIAIGHAVGQQHTLPGSIGETSATYDSARRVALIWEIQPNVYKPSGDRNRSIAKLYRRHRNWHLATLAAAIDWFRDRSVQVFLLRGEALAPTHEVNPEKPVSEMIVAHHNRTVQQVAASLGFTLEDPTSDDEFTLLEASVMNHALRKHILQNGAGGWIWRLRF